MKACPLRMYGLDEEDAEPEDLLRCAAALPWADLRQCLRYRGYGPQGLLCLMHATRQARGLRVYVPKLREY